MPHTRSFALRLRTGASKLEGGRVGGRFKTDDVVKDAPLPEFKFDLSTLAAAFAPVRPLRPQRRIVKKIQVRHLYLYWDAAQPSLRLWKGIVKLQHSFPVYRLTVLRYIHTVCCRLQCLGTHSWSSLCSEQAIYLIASLLAEAAFALSHPTA